MSRRVHWRRSGLSPWVAGIAAICAGAMLGAINGALVAYVRIPSIVVTLAAMVALRDALRWITQGAWVQDLPAEFQWLGTTQAVYDVITFVIAAALLAAGSDGDCAIWPRDGRSMRRDRTRSGAAGGNRSAISSFSVFAITGALTGLRAAAEFGPLQPDSQQRRDRAGDESDRGGGGGRHRDHGRAGKCRGTVLGVILLGMIGPALTFLGISAYWEKAIQGSIILCAVVLDATRFGSARSACSAHSVSLALAPDVDCCSRCWLKSSFLAPRKTSFHDREFFEVMRFSVELGLLALALTPVIITGGIDLRWVR